MVMRQEHKAGEKAFVDWAGATIPIYDRDTGVAWQAPLFVAALGASSYTWAEATRDQQMEVWLRAHVHAFDYWGGVPALAVPDNTKTGVSKAHRYDPDLNPTYHNFAVHYGFGVVPARPYKPRDKAVVENAVQVAQRWIVAALRHRKFFSLEEANQAIGELLHRLNHRPFRKRDGSRASVFEALDKPALNPLPSESVRHEPMVAGAGQYRLSRGLRRQLLQRSLQPGARAGGDPLDAHHGGDPAQGHARGFAPAQPRPGTSRHQSTSTAPRVIRRIWNGRRRAWCNGRRRSARTPRGCSSGSWPTSRTRRWAIAVAWASSGWPDNTLMPRMEAAAERALLTGACRYRSVESILKNSLDQQPCHRRRPRRSHHRHDDNIRGAEYFE